MESEITKPAATKPSLVVYCRHYASQVPSSDIIRDTCFRSRRLATIVNPPKFKPTYHRALTLLAASCTMNWVRALSSAVRAFGLHPKGRPFKSDSAHHCDAPPFSGDVVQLVRTLPRHSLESHTVTAESQSQLPHRISSWDQRW